MVDMTKGMGSTGDGEWMTPSWMVGVLDREFGRFDLDPCAKPESAMSAACGTAFVFNKKASLVTPFVYNDGLKADWFGQVFVNPPYGNGIGEWFEKASSECEKGNCDVAVFLVAARSDTEWWHRWAMKAHEIVFLNGRVGFDHLTKNTSSPAFPSVLIIFRRGRRRWGRPLISSMSVREDKTLANKEAKKTVKADRPKKGKRTAVGKGTKKQQGTKEDAEKVRKAFGKLVKRR